MFTSIWQYRSSRYAKITAASACLLVISYLIYVPETGAGGGTWLGYALGVFSAGLSVFLGWYGVRKRQYGRTGARLEEWLSAHVYFGFLLVLAATLHTGFEFGKNLHTASYFLLLAISFSGCVGVFLYNTIPKLMAENADGVSIDGMIERIADANLEAREIATILDDETNRLLRRSVEYTKIGGSLRSLFMVKNADHLSELALAQIRKLAKTYVGPESEVSRRLVSLLARKLEMQKRLRRQLRYKAILDSWLYLHLPLTFLYLVALVGHIFFVFYY